MKQNFLLLCAMALAGLFVSCSQTEMEEPANVPQKGNEVTVTVAPSADFTQPRSRAESGQQLRYIAELWEEDKTTDSANPTTKKLIARTEQVGTDANKFTFDVTEQGDYVILFWADYISTSAQQSDKTITRSSGENTFTVNFQGYEDNEFTTNGNGASKEGLQGVQIKTRSNKDEFYNGTTLEAFCSKVAFTKKNDIVSLDQVTLKRPLCKYIFKEKTADLSVISKVNIKFIEYYYQYNVYKEKTTNTGQYNGGVSSGMAIDILNSSEQQLFSFYSFAGKSEGTLSTYTMKFNFTANDNNKKYTDAQIASSKIPCRANYIYTLSGSFVQQDLTGNTVSVNVTRNENWSNDDRDL